jgi:3'-phosphoadenosine 5'-phosphosulfate sulfotransferase (PAPS reductase)/FAD synthetase
LDQKTGGDKMNILSFSGGKDSTAAAHIMLEHNIRIDDIMYFETGWEFPQIENHIALFEKNIGIPVTRIRYYRHFNDLLKRYGWPHKSGGWCVACKTDTCKKYFRAVKGTCEFIGFAKGEETRCAKQNKKWEVRFPLVEFNFTETDSLDYCKKLGYHWDGLYDVFNRVSCFCCPKAGDKRIKQLKEYFPELYKQYMRIEAIK